MDHQDTLLYHRTARQRRGMLQPLSENAERNLEDRNPFTYIYVSPCQIEVSNDPYKQVPYEDMTPCNLTSYECPNLRANVPRTATMSIAFSYELHYKMGSDINATLETLEGSQLQHLASMAGLLQCDGISVSRTGNDRVLESDSLLSSKEQKALIGISSFPLDTPDFQSNECILPEESSTTESSKCLPIKGSMTATIDANATAAEQSSIERTLMRVVRDGMQDDVYVTGNVTKVSFVGFRSSDVTAPSTSIQTEQQSKSSAPLSSLSIALICVALLVLFLVLALFVTKRRRKRESQPKHGATNSQDGLNSDLFVHTRAAPSILDADIEGADIPGSLANKDELALEVQAPTTGTPPKTGYLSVDDPLTEKSSLHHPLPSASLMSSFDAVEYLADTMSFGEVSTEGETMKYKEDERNTLPKEKEITGENARQSLFVSTRELNNALNPKKFVTQIPTSFQSTMELSATAQPNDGSDKTDDYPVSYIMT